MSLAHVHCHVVYQVGSINLYSECVLMKGFWGPGYFWFGLASSKSGGATRFAARCTNYTKHMYSGALQ